jgi:Tfp pilus assembly protein PilF
MEATLDPGKAPMPSDVEGAVANRHVNMGRMFAKARKWDKAEQQAREALAKEPSSAPAHLLLADVLAGKGDCGAAAKEYDEALRLDPRSAAAAEGKRGCRE